MQEIEPRLTKTGITIWIEYPFSWKFVEVCRKLGVRWDAKIKKRYIKFSNAALPLTAERLMENYKEMFSFFEPQLVETFRLTIKTMIRIKNVLPPILEEPLDLSGYTDLFQHQKTGIQFLHNKKGNCILADEQGLGKTKTAGIWLINSQFEKNIIVTPYSARFIWKNELITLGIPEEYINVVEKDIGNRFVIINYDKLKKFEKLILKEKIDCFIFDEAHYLKNRTSQRFKLTEKLTKKTKHVLLITGTPVSNRPEEIFPLLRLIKAPLGSNFTEFADRYCARRLVSHGIGQHYDTSGSSNLDELGYKLKHHMIRRLKKDCLDLPGKLKTTFFLDMSPKELDIYEKMTLGISKYIKINGYSKKITPEILAQLSLMRQYCSDIKIRHTDSLIKDAIAAGEKVLIFGFYNYTLKKLHEKYKKSSVIITGETIKKGERELIQEQFQTNPDIKIFFGNIKAAGVALTLIAGSKIIFNDLSWNPTDHLQAEDRIHRIGTINTSNIIYLVFKESIEEYIFNILKHKESMIDKILSESEEHFNEEVVIKQLLEKYNEISKNKNN
jgi:SWI/SNF-related matrix-associated actin-dependent regulator 1 of chromatin subfamily A